MRPPPLLVTMSNKNVSDQKLNCLGHTCFCEPEDDERRNDEPVSAVHDEAPEDLAKQKISRRYNNDNPGDPRFVLTNIASAMLVCAA